MCWRDDVLMTRYCDLCKQNYYGDFGHRGCPSTQPPTTEEEAQELKDLVHTLDKHLEDTTAWINGMGEEDLLRIYSGIFKKQHRGSVQEARESLIAHFKEESDLAKSMALPSS